MVMDSKKKMAGMALSVKAGKKGKSGWLGGDSHSGKMGIERINGKKSKGRHYIDGKDRADALKS